MGLSTKQLFGMILSESFLLGFIGTILGIIPGILLVYYFQIHPIDYSAMAETFAVYEGLDAVIGTFLSIKSAIYVFITGVLISILASLYPAYIAIKKKPVEVIRMTT
jgi:putative ABC transport system permease protein